MLNNYYFLIIKNRKMKSDGNYVFLLSFWKEKKLLV